jgi:hypothetical protein
MRHGPLKIRFVMQSATMLHDGHKLSEPEDPKQTKQTVKHDPVWNEQLMHKTTK